MGSSSTSWSSESNTHAGSSKVFSSSTWDAYVSTNGLKIQGAEGNAGILELFADEGDDNADKWKWQVADGGSMTWQTYTTGSYSPKLTLGTGGDLTIGGDLAITGGNITTALTLDSTLTVGVNDTGYDVKFFGATSGKYMLWDESADSLVLNNGSTQNDKFLHFLSSANYGIKFEYTGQETYEILHGVSGLFVDLGGTSLMAWTQEHDLKIFDNSGNAYANFDGSTSRLGIGTTAPLYNLDVRGTGVKNSGVVSTDNNALLYLTAGTDGATDDKIAYIYMGKISGSNHGVIKYSNSATATSKKMEFQVNGTAPLTLDGNGRAGIGTTGPASTLHVAGTVQVGVDNTGHDVKFYGATASNYMLWDESEDQLILQGDTAMMKISTTSHSDTNPQLLIEGNTGGSSPSSATRIVLNSNTDGRAKGISFENTDNSEEWFVGVPYQSTDPDFFVIGYHDDPDEAAKEPWYTAQTKFCVRGDGKVGIGTVSPGVQLEVEGTGDPTIHVGLKATALTDTDRASFRVHGTGNSVANQAELGVWYENGADTNAPTSFMRLQASDGDAYFYFSGDDGKFYKTSTTTNIGIDGSSTLVGGESSDERLKDISSDAFPYGLSEVNQLVPIKYKYKADKKQRNHIGFGAQTTQSIVPESVMVTKDCIDGYTEGVDADGRDIFTPNSDDANPKMVMEYVQLIPVLVKAIQELSVKVTALENA